MVAVIPYYTCKNMGKDLPESFPLTMDLPVISWQRRVASGEGWATSPGHPPLQPGVNSIQVL